MLMSLFWCNLLCSLPLEFGPFQVNYNTLKDKWNIQDAKAMLIQEEGRLKKNGVHSTHLMVDNGASSSKEKPGNKGKKVKNPLHVNEGQIHKKPRCHFCKKTSHFKKDRPKRKKWFEKKGINYYISVCLESNLVEVPSNTWWLDCGATTHVSHITQGFLMIQLISGPKQFLYMGNRMKARIEGIGTYRITLETVLHLDWKECLCVPK